MVDRSYKPKTKAPPEFERMAEYFPNAFKFEDDGLGAEKNRRPKKPKHKLLFLNL
jgi:hypothetical protein